MKAIINSKPGILYPIISGSSPFGLNLWGTKPVMNSTIKIVMYMVAPIGAEISKPVKKYLFSYLLAYIDFLTDS